MSAQEDRNKGGLCARGACGRMHERWQHPHTKLLYCADCAKLINVEMRKHNFDLVSHLGPPLLAVGEYLLIVNSVDLRVLRSGSPSALATFVVVDGPDEHTQHTAGWVWGRLDGAGGLSAMRFKQFLDALGINGDTLSEWVAAGNVDEMLARLRLSLVRCSVIAQPLKARPDAEGNTRSVSVATWTAVDMTSAQLAEQIERRALALPSQQSDLAGAMLTLAGQLLASNDDTHVAADRFIDLISNFDK